MTATPAPAPTAAIVLGLLVSFLVAGMFTAWAWFLLRLRDRQPVLPPTPLPRIVPWGWRSMLALFLATVVVGFAAGVAYQPLRQSFIPGYSGRRSTPDSAESGERSAPRGSLRVDKSAGKPGAVGSKSGSGKETTDNERAAEQMFMLSAINATLIVLLPLLLRGTSGASWKDLGLTTGHLFKNVRLGVLAFLLATPVVMGIHLAAQLVWQVIWPENRHPLMEMLKIGTSPSDIYLAYLSAAVLAPVTEELIFRGILQGWFRRVLLLDYLNHRSGPDDDTSGEARGVTSDSLGVDSISVVRSRLPVVITSLVFATVHFSQMPAPIGIFFLSLVLGTLYERTGSLVPSIVLHGLFNAFNTTLFLAALLGPGVPTQAQ